MRDRATLYLAQLTGNAGGTAAIENSWSIPARNLEKSLRAYLEADQLEPFDLVRLPFNPRQLSSYLLYKTRHGVLAVSSSYEGRFACVHVKDQRCAVYSCCITAFSCAFFNAADTSRTGFAQNAFCAHGL